MGDIGVTRQPGEFELHKNTYLLWPNRPDNWRDGAVHAQRDVILLANSIARYESVTLGTNVPLADEARHQLTSNITVVPFKYDDIWIRDTGPTYLCSDKSLECIKWRFNSWGGLLPEHELDSTVAEQVSDLEDLPIRTVDLTFEGGAMITDGDGLVITTEDCILDKRRNPASTKSHAEFQLCSGLGATSIFWIPHGLKFDETGGHIDNVCFFGNSKTLFVSRATKDNDNFDRTEEAFELLCAFNDSNLLGYRIVQLPLPHTLSVTRAEARGFSLSSGNIVREEGTPFCASYANSYMINGAIIVPKFGSPFDDQAAQIIADTLPDRDVIQVPSREFSLGGGAVHCITKEVPLTVSARKK